jgi:nucleoside-diphosphate-sugar epimerase
VGIALVTGGSGYFGSVVVRHLRARGDRVRVFDLIDAPDRPTDVELVQGDIRNPDDVKKALVDVDVIHHNVAVVPLAKNKELFWTVNRDGTRVLLDEAERAGVRKIVNVSSSAVFGAPDRNPVDESVPPAPGEEYGQAKRAGEILCEEAVARGQDVTIVRPRTIIGAGRLGIMQILFEWIRQGRALPLVGGGDNRYQFVSGDDLARACLLAADHPGADVFHVGAEDFGTMRETLESLAAHAGTGSRVITFPTGPTVLAMKVANRLGLSPLGAYHALMYHRAMWFDVSHCKQVVGWSAQQSNADMFAEAYDWYLVHRDEVLAQRKASHHRSAVRPGILDLVSRLG